MNKNDILNRLRELSKKPVFLKCAVGLGVLMIILIVISDKPDEPDYYNTGSDEINFVTSEVYADDTESQLRKILMTVEGVGKAEVMLTINSTEEYVYAEAVKQGSDRHENSFVIIDNGTQKEALVRKINNPAISGVVIVCEGGDDPRICEKIYRAVSTALDISTSKIYVTEMK